MKQTENIKVIDGNMIQIPQKAMNQLALKIGDTISIEWDNQSIRKKCFYIKDDNDKEMFDEGFYCIPERFLFNCGISADHVQILEGDGTLTMMTSDRLISSLGGEVIACLMLQNVNFDRLADDLADCLNDLYEDELKSDDIE